MKVIDLNQQPKNSRFYSVVLFYKTIWKAMKMFPNISESSLEDETKSSLFWICKKNQMVLHAVAAVLQYKLDKNFILSLESNFSKAHAQHWPALTGWASIFDLKIFGAICLSKHSYTVLLTKRPELDLEDLS